MSEGVIQLELRDDIAVVRIHRPETKNSLTVPQMEQLRLALLQAMQSRARCLLLAGTATAFCAGRDLKEVDPLQDDTYQVMSGTIIPLLKTVHDMDIPTVAAVQGPALGLGLGLALCCDIVLVAENAVFGSPFRHFGGVLDSGGHYFLEQRIGRHRAAELIFTGQLISGVQAASLGLVNRAVPAVELEEQSWRLCRDIATGPTAAFKATKRILAQPREFAEVLELEAREMAAALKSADGREGVQAFKEKRSPKFTGA